MRPPFSSRRRCSSLKVTPQITPDNRIIMDLTVSKDSVGQVIVDLVRRQRALHRHARNRHPGPGQRWSDGGARRHHGDRVPRDRKQGAVGWVTSGPWPCCSETRARPRTRTSSDLHYAADPARGRKPLLTPARRKLRIIRGRFTQRPRATACSRNATFSSSDRWARARPPSAGTWPAL